MNATFNIKVTVDSNHVVTSFGSDRIENMETTLLAGILKIFGDVENKVKAQVAKYYGTDSKEPETEKPETAEQPQTPAQPESNENPTNEQ